MTDAKTYILNHFRNTTKPLAFNRDDLVWSFGFQRRSGEEIMLTKILRPSMSEMDIQTLPRDEMNENIEKWCKANYLQFHEDHQSRLCIFELGMSKSIRYSANDIQITDIN